MFRQMKIALRAGLGFGFVALIVFALGVFALTRISAMESEAEEIDQRLCRQFSYWDRRTKSSFGSVPEPCVCLSVTSRSSAVVSTA